MSAPRFARTAIYESGSLRAPIRFHVKPLDPTCYRINWHGAPLVIQEVGHFGEPVGQPGSPDSGLARIASHIPPGQFARYLVVGVWNTGFGFGTFALLTAWLTPKIPHAYIAASLLSSVLNITVAFLGYKWFVFRTRGNYLKEWLRCLAVYSGSLLLGLLLLPVAVEAVRRFTGNGRTAPYIGGALLTGASVIYSFFGHRRFTFRPLPASSTPDR
jgi:putative flippase GtrA